MKAAKFNIKADGSATFAKAGTASELLKEVRGISSSDFPKDVVEIHVWTASEGKVKQVRLENVKLNEARKGTPAEKKAVKKTAQK